WRNIEIRFSLPEKAARTQVEAKALSLALAVRQVHPRPALSDVARAGVGCDRPARARRMGGSAAIRTRLRDGIRDGAAPGNASHRRLQPRREPRLADPRLSARDPARRRRESAERDL